MSENMKQVPQAGRDTASVSESCPGRTPGCPSDSGEGTSTFKNVATINIVADQEGRSRMLPRNKLLSHARRSNSSSNVADEIVKKRKAKIFGEEDRGASGEEVCKRKEDPIAFVINEAINHVIKGVGNLDRVVSENQNTKREIKEIMVQLRKGVDILKRQSSQEWFNQHRFERAEMPTYEVRGRDTQTEKAKTGVDMGIQCDMSEKVYSLTEAKSGNPLTTADNDWDFAVWKVKEDLSMDRGIQRIFRDRYPDIAKLEGPVGHMVASTKIIGKAGEIVESDRHILRLDLENDYDTIEGKSEAKERLQEMRKRFEGAGRQKVAIPWDATSSTTGFNDILEEVLEGSSIQAVIHLPIPKAAVRSNNDDDTPRSNRKRQIGDAVIVKRSLETTYASLVREVKQEILAKGLQKDVQGIRETKAGEVLITLTKKTKSEGMRNLLTDKMGKANVRVMRDPEENTIFHIRDIDVTTTSEEVASEIGEISKLGKVPNEDISVEVKSLRHGFAGTQSPTIVVDRKTAQVLSNSKFVKIGLPNCRIKRHIVVDFCHRCWEGRHAAVNCKGPDRSNVCRNCEEEGHERRKCQKPPKCVVCDKPGHPANTTRCPKFRRNLKEASGTTTPVRTTHKERSTPRSTPNQRGEWTKVQSKGRKSPVAQNGQSPIRNTNTNAN